MKNFPEDRHVIQKSTPLLSLWRSPLTLSEFKILDVCLSRIDPHNPENRTVRIEKKELEEVLGVQRISLPDLNKRIEHLGIMVKVEDFEASHGFRSVALFEEASCVLDENGQWRVDLECTAKAMRYVFNIENIGYLRYQLQSIVRIGSRYSYLLFLYIERNRFRNTWEEDLESLRVQLGCGPDTYPSFKSFNKDVLKRAWAELNEKTECRFSYEPVRKGRFVRRIRFTVEPASPAAPNAGHPAALPSADEAGSGESHCGTMPT